MRSAITFLDQLSTIRVLVDAAQSQLDDVAADYADLAIHNLANADGVGHGHPYRPVPPAGVMGWYDDLLERAAAQPELIDDIQAARKRCKVSWLAEESVLPGTRRQALAKRLRLVPEAREADAVDLGGDWCCSGEGNWSACGPTTPWNVIATAIARTRTRCHGAEDYQQRIDETDRHIREFLAEQTDHHDSRTTSVNWTPMPRGSCVPAGAISGKKSSSVTPPGSPACRDPGPSI